MADRDPLEWFDYIHPGMGECWLCPWFATIKDDTVLVEAFLAHWERTHNPQPDGGAA